MEVIEVYTDNKVDALLWLLQLNYFKFWNGMDEPTKLTPSLLNLTAENSEILIIII